MNQHQRKFLLEEIEKQYKRERDELNKRKPDAPSLNNYLTAAILDGSAVMRSLESVTESIRERVRDLGKGESLVSEHSRWGRGKDEQDCISLPALLLFEMPKAFEEVQKKYEQEEETWQNEAKALDASINAMRIKVQVGSDTALEALVRQADQLCSMSLTASSRLMLNEKST